MFSKIQIAAAGLALASGVAAKPSEAAGQLLSVYGNCLEAEKLGVPCSSDPAQCTPEAPCPDTDSSAATNNSTATRRATTVSWVILTNNPTDKAADAIPNGGYMGYSLFEVDSQSTALTKAEEQCLKMKPDDMPACKAVDCYLDNNSNAKDDYGPATKYSCAFFSNFITVSQVTNAGHQAQRDGENYITNHASANYGPPPSINQCPNLGTVKSAIRILRANDLNAPRLGFLGEVSSGDNRLFNYGYSGYFAPGYTSSGGTLFSACNDVNSRGFESIVIADGRAGTNFIGSFLCISTNQYNNGYSQDIDSYDTNARIVNNYLSPYQCGGKGDLTQEVDWKWDAVSGLITIDWLQKDGSHVVATPYFSTSTYEVRLYGPKTIAGEGNRRIPANFVQAALQWVTLP